MSDFDPYKILGVDKGATNPVIKAAYRLRSKETHPDIVGDAGRDAFELVNRAWNLLSNPITRKLFDENGIVEEEAPNKLRKNVSEFIVSIFDKVLDQALTKETPLNEYDFIGFMRFSTKEVIDGAKVDSSDVRKRIAELAALKKRIRRGNEGENVFTTRLDERIVRTSNELKELDFNILVMENAMVELENYSTEADLMRTFYATSTNATPPWGNF